jgi:hypothetical protein
MLLEKFLLKDKYNLVQSSFIKDGWLTIYTYESTETENEITNIYCYLVDESYIEEYLKHWRWEIEKGQEGIPAISEHRLGGEKSYTYETHMTKGIQPFIFYHSFNIDDGCVNYITISEEFIQYFKLYEKRQSNWDRIFYYIDEVRDKEEVIVITQNNVVIKLKFLMEYLSIRKFHFSIGFDIMRICNDSLAKLGISKKDENISSLDLIYNHTIKELFNSDKKSMSWIFGKKIIKFNKDYKDFHFDYDNNSKYVEFIVGYDAQGEEIFKTSKNSDESFFDLVFFRKDVLNKYYNDPDKYQVSKLEINSNYFSMIIDNDSEVDHVKVFLNKLGRIPYKEQLYWKSYNISPPRIPKISKAFYKSMVEGQFTEYSESIDLFFKEKYVQFNTAWESKFGWKFYKPLSRADQFIFTSLHLPPLNNVKTFSEQILSMAKLTIDKLNEAEISKNISLEANDKGITKLDKFLRYYEFNIPDLICFLRNLWKLRSGLAHGFSDSNKPCNDAISFFGISDKKYKDVAQRIFYDSINTLNTLEECFIKNDKIQNV